MKRKRMDVYIYMTSSDDSIKYNLKYLTEYSEKKTTHITAIFIDYCEKTVAIENRPSLQNLLNIKKPVKFIVCCSEKSDFPDVNMIENLINQQGGKMDFYWDIVKERNRKAEERFRLKTGIESPFTS